MHKPERSKEKDEMSELKKFYEMKKKEQKALRRLLDELTKKSRNDKPDKSS
jgi:hypothetical protein